MRKQCTDLASGEWRVASSRSAASSLECNLASGKWRVASSRSANAAIAANAANYGTPTSHSPLATSQKRGISLIAVLMFMLAATTASVVLFKWLGTENFASGSRLKHTEAYQAAESGLDAVQAWLSSRGMDAGKLATQYLHDPNASLKGKPVNMTAVLGSVGGKRQQGFEVYLLGINSNAKKFEFLSVGRGRDNSKVKLAGIFDVEGLYRAQVPTAEEQTVTNTDCDPPGQFNYAYFGGSTLFQGNKTFESMAVNGNWVKNPPTISGDFIITGDLKTEGSSANVGGKLCVGGELWQHNNAALNVHDVYFGTATTLNGTINGNVYAGGNFTLNNNGTFTINKSLHALGTIPTSLQTLVKENLVLEGSNAKIDASGGQKFSVCDTVWSNTAGGVRGNLSQGANIHFNSGKNNSDGCATKPNAILAFKDAASSGNPSANYKTQPEPPVGYFYSPLNSNSTPTTGATGNKPKEAENVRDYCFDKWTTSSGCDGSKYVIEDPVAASLNSIETHYNNNSPTCAKNVKPTNNSTWVLNLNTCYSTNSSKLYNGYLVVKFAYEGNIYDGATTSIALQGKFIFIYDFNFNNQDLVLPPTKPTTNVMVFLKDGGIRALRSNQCNTAKDPYNYFIYSFKTINTTLTWNKECPLKGSIFFPSSTCNSLIDADNDFQALTNPELYKDLMAAGILCNRPKGSGLNYTSSCTTTEIANTIDPSSGGASCGTTTSYTYDTEQEERFIAASSRLKVSLASKNISSKPAPETAVVLGNEVLVMPRVVKLAKNSGNYGSALNDFYSPVSLNGLSASSSQTFTCEPMGGSPDWTYLPSGDGSYKCTPTSGSNYSNFYVVYQNTDLNLGMDRWKKEARDAATAAVAAANKAIGDDEELDIAQEMAQEMANSASSASAMADAASDEDEAERWAAVARAYEYAARAYAAAAEAKMLTGTGGDCSPRTLGELADDALTSAGAASSAAGAASTAANSGNKTTAIAKREEAKAAMEAAEAAVAAARECAIPKITSCFGEPKTDFSVTLGQPISLQITCSRGDPDISGASFDPAGDLPADAAANWKAGESAIYNKIGDAGVHAIKVSNITCGGKTPSNLPYECETIKVEKPTCELDETTKEPIVKCSEDGPVLDNQASPKLFYTTAWNGNSYLTSIKCNETTISISYTSSSERIDCGKACGGSFLEPCESGGGSSGGSSSGSFLEPEELTP